MFNLHPVELNIYRGSPFCDCTPPLQEGHYMDFFY